ncbi:class I SAM-dependent methyltransferase [soil metagenome]
MKPRLTSSPEFWNERYAEDGWAFGDEPGPWMREQLNRLPSGASVADLGAGEGRAGLYLARRGHPVLAVDFAQDGLRKLERIAAAEGLNISVNVRDLGEPWPEAPEVDAIAISFVQLLPRERQQLFATATAMLRHGGVMFGELFSLRHISPEFSRIGPSSPDRLLSLDEIRTALKSGTFSEIEDADTQLDEGRYLQGRAAVLRFRWVKS